MRSIAEITESEVGEDVASEIEKIEDLLDELETVIECNKKLPIFSDPKPYNFSELFKIIVGADIDVDQRFIFLKELSQLATSTNANETVDDSEKLLSSNPVVSVRCYSN